MLAGSVAFAVMGSAAHLLGAYCDWQVIAVVRAGSVLVFATVLALVGGARLVLWRPATLWARSIAGSVSMVATFFAFTRLPVSDVLTLTNVFPIWVALLSWPLLGEPPGLIALLAVGCAVLGVGLIQQPHLAEGNLATVVAAGASLFTAVAMLGLHRLRGLNPLAIVVHFSAVALVFCTASAFVFERSVPLVNLLGLWPLLLLLTLAVSATVGQLLLTKAFAAGSPTRVSVVGLTQIVFALGLDLLLLRQPIRLETLAGIVLVMGPTAWLMLHRPATEVVPAPTPDPVPRGRTAAARDV